MRLFRELNEDRGITIVLVTHEEDIAAYARRHIRFRDGRIESDRANLKLEQRADDRQRHHAGASRNPPQPDARGADHARHRHRRRRGHRAW